MQRLFLILLLFISQLYCIAQLPDTDIWLLDLNIKKDSIVLTNPVNITNRRGYDNQPSFSPDGKYMYYTSMKGEKQSDIYKYDLKTKTISQFTNTSTSEYSPNVTPDGKSISVVMVEPDSTQRLWTFPIKGGMPSLIMKDVDSIGYYCWINADTLAFITAAEPQVLNLVSIKSQKLNFISDSVGRCMQKINKTKFLFVQKATEQIGTFKEFDLKENKITKRTDCASTLPDSEDYVFKGNHIFMGNKEKIFALEYSTKIWKPITDLSSYGITTIKRMAISPDGKKLAIVAESKN